MTADEYKALIQPAMDVVVKKHQDYNRGGVTLESYFPFGLKSYAQMLHVKNQRLLSLASSSAPIANEALEDTVIDMINYAVFTLAFLKSGR